MTDVMCVIQEGGPADAARAELEAALAAVHAEHHPGDTVRVGWRPIPQGFMFTEGVQSTSSIVSLGVRRRTELAEREAYMRGVCDVWTRITGCTDHEVVVAVTPPADSTTKGA